MGHVPCDDAHAVRAALAQTYCDHPVRYSLMKSNELAARRAEPWVVALLSLSSLVMLVSLPLGWGIALAIGLVGHYVGELLLYVAAPARAKWMGRRHLGSGARTIFRQTFAIVGWILIADPMSALVALVAATIAFGHAAHFTYRVLASRNQANRAGRLRWAHLEVNGHTEGPELLPLTLPRIIGVTGPRLVLMTDVVLLASLGVGGLVGSAWPVVAGCAAQAGACLWALILGVRRNRLIQRLQSPEEENAQLLAALAATNPEVAVYFSGGRGTTYQLNVWLETLNRLHRPAVIMLREGRHLEQMQPTNIPTVVLPQAQNVERAQFASLKVALYPTTVINNNHMIRLRGLRHIFINHGDGDKAVTYSPLHRVFDEIWVAGQAAVDRYLQRGEGIRADQLRQVGRPQLAGIRPSEGFPTADEVVTVLYAPTWEGNFDDVNYSSVAPMGAEIIEQLITLPRPVRVLFKPHPATGTRLPEAAAGRRAIEERLASLPEHLVVPDEQGALHDAFNECDILISDVSSVVADFLASRKPYLMTNPQQDPVERFHERFPSTRGGSVLDPDDLRVHELIMDVLASDPLAAKRQELATYFLGQHQADPIGHFADAIDDACARVSMETITEDGQANPRPSHPAEEVTP